MIWGEHDGGALGGWLHAPALVRAAARSEGIARPGPCVRSNGDVCCVPWARVAAGTALRRGVSCATDVLILSAYATHECRLRRARCCPDTSLLRSGEGSGRSRLMTAFGELGEHGLWLRLVVALRFLLL